MLTESGKVVAIDAESLWVETISTSACGRCSASQACGQGLLNRWAARNSYLQLALDGRLPSEFSLGDTVTIGIPEDVVLTSSLLMYCLPLLLMTGGVVTGHMAAGSDAGAIGGALLGLISGWLLVKMLGKRLESKRRLRPVILDLLPSSSAPAISN